MVYVKNYKMHFWRNATKSDFLSLYSSVILFNASVAL